MERDDQVAVDSLITMLRRSFSHVSDVLVIISLVTLDRLDAALNGEGRPGAGSDVDAGRLISHAVRSGRAERCSVAAAAWRLEAIRLGDLEGIGADIAESRFIASDDELMRGAIALLATIVALGAQRDGVRAGQAAEDLCLAAAMSPAGG
jgi:hypothetical protein